MIDSVLKGTGNSRFLKSAVPAGTSWADALAMLQAGTFPIDFNGINTEGFQQVGTPLNKANLLKDATAAQIGLPPSTTPDGMFRALGNTGELHVWRKTVVSDKAGYTLGSNKNLIVYQNSQGYAGDQYTAFWSVSASVTVDSTGKVSLSNPTEVRVNWTEGETDMKGKFIQFSRVGHSTTSVGDTTGIYYIPTSAQFQKANSAVTILDAQPVNGYAQGTTTTYPVSTNPNAYQEGDDAKEAGYTLGEPKTTVIPIHPGNTIDPFYYGDTNNVAVTDDGVVSVSSGTYVSLSPYNTNNTDSVKGKYIQGYPTGYPVTSVYYIPADATFSNANGELVCDKAQLVTGYAAIPAGTTIEYLGKLGDKARVQVVSYVGTGTYGKDNPCSLTFDFPPKVVMFIASVYVNVTNSVGQLNHFFNNYSNIASELTRLLTEPLTTNFLQSAGFGNTSSYAKKSIDGRVITWYNQSGNDYQGNIRGKKYYYLGIG